MENCFPWIWHFAWHREPTVVECELHESWTSFRCKLVRFCLPVHAEHCPNLVLLYLILSLLHFLLRIHTFVVKNPSPLLAQFSWRISCTDIWAVSEGFQIFLRLDILGFWFVLLLNKWLRACIFADPMVNAFCGPNISDVTFLKLVIGCSYANCSSSVHSKRLIRFLIKSLRSTCDVNPSVIGAFVEGTHNESKNVLESDDDISTFCNLSRHACTSWRFQFILLYAYSQTVPSNNQFIFRLQEYYTVLQITFVRPVQNTLLNDRKWFLIPLAYVRATDRWLRSDR